MKSNKLTPSITLKILKIIDTSIQVMIYGSIVVTILLNLEEFSEVKSLLRASIALFSTLGVYQAISFFIQLISWHRYPSIFKSRIIYVLAIIAGAILALLFYPKHDDNSLIFLVVVFHLIALFYLIISIRESKSIISNKSKTIPNLSN